MLWSIPSQSAIMSFLLLVCVTRMFWLTRSIQINSQPTNGCHTGASCGRRRLNLPAMFSQTLPLPAHQSSNSDAASDSPESPHHLPGGEYS